MKILVVDDTRTSLLVISQYVERLGATAIQADCGERAIEVFQAEKPDLVLLDIILPDLDGFAVAHRLRALEVNGGWTPIIFLSSLNRDEDIERGIAAGGDDYLSKPISEVVLGAKIRAMQRIIQMRTSLVVLARKLDSANQELKRLSAIDGLTGISNRRLFDDFIAREWRRARRAECSVALMMCDVDHFKRFNDTYGHQAGDDCLRQVASAIQSVMDRASDIVARYGGEEFVVVLPETSIGGALFVAEKIRHAVHALNIPHAESPQGRVTLSIGIANHVPVENENPEILISAADRALYQAKHDGRDRVCRCAPLLCH
ncbi:MAG: diguanylate cyclase [Rhodocyclales bacterium GT-UBC]|nr:MAG: diguanylate cyclase [Rhodocyclales bacterium GT-UBC]